MRKRNEGKGNSGSYKLIGGAAALIFKNGLHAESGFRHMFFKSRRRIARFLLLIQMLGILIRGRFKKVIDGFSGAKACDALHRISKVERIMTAKRRRAIALSYLRLDLVPGVPNFA